MRDATRFVQNCTGWSGLPSVKVLPTIPSTAGHCGCQGKRANVTARDRPQREPVLEDRYGNSLSTASQAARDAYVEGCDLLFAFWPGGDEAFARATAADPNFALAHLGGAQFAAMRGNIPNRVWARRTASRR
jgi:hypothetical protein